MSRFAEKTDTPCPFRLGRMGWARTGEFRIPRAGEMFIEPTETDELQEHEPVVLGACGELTEPRHIVQALTKETQQELAELPGLLFLLAGSDEAHEELIRIESIGRRLEENDPCD